MGHRDTIAALPRNETIVAANRFAQSLPFLETRVGQRQCTDSPDKPATNPASCLTPNTTPPRNSACCAAVTLLRIPHELPNDGPDAVGSRPRDRGR